MPTGAIRFGLNISWPISRKMKCLREFSFQKDKEEVMHL